MPTPIRAPVSCQPFLARPDARGHRRPDGETDADQPDAVPIVRQPPERNAEQRIEHPERGAIQEADIGIVQPQVALDVLGEDRDDLPVDEVEDVDEEQDDQHVPGIGAAPFSGSPTMVSAPAMIPPRYSFRGMGIRAAGRETALSAVSGAPSVEHGAPVVRAIPKQRVVLARYARFATRPARAAATQPRWSMMPSAGPIALRTPRSASRARSVGVM